MQLYGPTLPESMARKERTDLIRKIEQRRDSHVICCLTSDRQNAQGIIAKDFIPVFFEHLRTFSHHKRIDCLMFTEGGDTLAAFGLSRLLREFTKDVGTLVPAKCQSAGTLFALGSDKIFMGRAATLSPIDPSITSPLNPVVEVAPGQRQLLPVSVESVVGYKTLVREDWRLGDEESALAFRILAEKVNPLALGDVYRGRQQIERLARTLLNAHRQDEHQVQRIVEMLTHGFGSHDYLVSRTEARELMGSQIAEDDAELEGLIWDLYCDYRDEMKLGTIFDANMVLQASGTGAGVPSVVDEQKVVVVETTEGGDEFERAIRLMQTQVMTPGGPVQAVQQALVRAGWKHYS